MKTGQNLAVVNKKKPDLTSTYVYDVLDRVIKVTDSLGNEVVNNYDANGQLWKVTHRYKKPDATFDLRDVPSVCPRYVSDLRHADFSTRLTVS